MGRTPKYELSQKEIEILKARYHEMLNDIGYGDPVPYGELGKKYGLSRERIRQYINQGITKLIRKYLL